MSAVFPEQDKMVIDVSTLCFEEIRKKLIETGTGRFVIERGTCGRVIDVGDLVIRTSYVARHDRSAA